MAGLGAVSCMGEPAKTKSREGRGRATIVGKHRANHTSHGPGMQLVTC